MACVPGRLRKGEALRPPRPHALTPSRPHALTPLFNALLLALSMIIAGSRSGIAQTPAQKGWDPMTFKKPNDAQLHATLTPMQYDVTQREATEPPFRNEYWHNEQPGLYVDVVSGEPLFSSLDKFDSGTGWPSFTKPLDPANIREKVDRGLFSERTEVRSAHAGSHLGHVFTDGPRPTGLRYCMNSAALRFVPADRLKDEGYEKYLPLFAVGTGTTPTPSK